MRIALIGATGGTGRAFADLALAAGHRVRALVRDPVPAALDPRLDIVVGDIREPGTAAAAIDGCEAVVCALGVRLGQSPGRVRSEGTATLLAAMAAPDIAGPLRSRRLIVVSAVGGAGSLARCTAPARWLLPRLIGRERLQEVDRQEALVQASDLSWTIVRAPRLIDGPARGVPAVGPELRVALRDVLARADLAQVLLQTVEQGRWPRQAVTAIAR